MRTLQESAQVLLDQEAQPEQSLLFLKEASKTLSHFLQYFVEKDELNESLCTEILNGFRNSVKKNSKLPKNVSFTLLSAALSLLKKREYGLELLQKVNDMLYEEVIHQPLPDSLLDPDQIPSAQDLLRIRNAQWNSSTRFLMDLLCQEGLSSEEVAKLLKLSSNVLEAHLFTLFHRLIGEVPVPEDTVDELQAIQDMLASKLSRMDSNPFSQRLAVLKGFLSLEIRSQLSRESLQILCKSWHPEYEIKEEDTSSSPSDSVIDKIRKQNHQRVHEEKQAAEQDVAEYLGTVNPESLPKANEDIIKYAKMAIPVLAFFFLFTTYKTLNPEVREEVVQDNVAVISLEDFNKQNQEILGEFTQDDLKTPVYPYQTYSSSSDSMEVELKNGVLLELEPYTSVTFTSMSDLQLVRGKIIIHLNKNKLQALCMHGRVEAQEGVIHLANWSPEYTIAGVFKGSLIAFDQFSQKFELSSGQQVRLGVQSSSSKSLVQEFNSQSFLRPGLKPRSTMKAQYSGHRTDYQDRLTEEEVLQLLPSNEEISTKPEQVQKDFFQKL